MAHAVALAACCFFHILTVVHNKVGLHHDIARGALRLRRTPLVQAIVLDLVWRPVRGVQVCCDVRHPRPHLRGSQLCIKLHQHSAPAADSGNMCCIQIRTETVVASICFAQGFPYSRAEHGNACRSYAQNVAGPSGHCQVQPGRMEGAGYLCPVAPTVAPILPGAMLVRYKALAHLQARNGSSG